MVSAKRTRRRVVEPREHDTMTHLSRRQSVVRRQPLLLRRRFARGLGRLRWTGRAGRGAPDTTREPPAPRTAGAIPAQHECRSRLLTPDPGERTLNCRAAAISVRRWQPRRSDTSDKSGGGHEVPADGFESEARNHPMTAATDRRSFVAYFSSLGLTSTLFPGVLWARLQNATTQRITKEMLRDAASVAGLTFSDRALDDMLEGVNRHRTVYDQ